MRTTDKILAVAMFIALALTACSDGPGTGSETHWLGCESEADCPLGAACVNGQCATESSDAGTPQNNENNNTNGGNNGNNTTGNNATNNVADAGAPLDMSADMGVGADVGDGSDMGTPTQPDIEILGDDLVFFSLPIGSDRAAISGYDATRDLCVSVIWFFGSADDRPPGGFCTHDLEQMRPYVYVEAGAEAGCWDYGANVETVSASGCADFAGYGAGHTDLADDIRVDVTGDLFTGTIRFHNQP